MSGQEVRVASPMPSIMRPSKWPWTIVSIALALSFVSGTFLAIDSSQRAIVAAKAATIPVDFIGTSTSSEALENPSYIDYNIDWIIHGPEDVRVIEACEVLTHAFLKDSLGNYQPYYTGGYYPLMFLPQDSQEFLTSYRISGDVPEKGTVALPQQMADDMSLSVGDTVTLYFPASEPRFDPAIGDFRWYSEEASFPFIVSQIWTQDGLKDQIVTLPDGGSQQYLDVDPRAVLIREFLNPVFVNIKDLYPIVNSFGSMLRSKYVDEESRTLYFIWIDREKYIDYADVEGSIHRLDALYARLSERCRSFGVDLMRSELVHAISVGQLGGTSGYRVYYLGLSLPVLVLGIYVTAVGASIGADMRENSLQSVAAQGIRRRTIVWNLMKESVSVGLVAGVIGYLLGIIVSNAFLSSIVTGLGWREDVDVTGVGYAFTWFTLLATLGLGVLAVVLVSSFVSMRVTKPPRPTKSEFKILHLLPITEVILIGLSLISVLGILSGTQWVGAHGFDWYVGSLDAILDNMVLISFPAMPLMLTVGLVGLLTRWPVDLQERLARFFSKYADKASIPSEPMAARCDKRSRRMSIIAALLLVLVIFVSVSMNTIVTTHKESVRLDIASDVDVDAEYIGGWWQGDAWYPDASFPTEANFSAIPGVSHAALHQSFQTTALWDQYTYPTTINPDSYLAAVGPTAKDANGDPTDVLSLLNSSTNVLVTESYAREKNVDRGDSMTMEMTGYVVGSNDSVVFTLNLNIAHIVNGLPGLSFVVLGYSAVSSIPKYTFDHIATRGGVFIEAEDDADEESIAAQAMQIFTSSGLYSEYARILDSEMEDIDDNPEQGGLFKFLTAESGISALVVLVGVAMTSYSTAKFAVTASSKPGTTREEIKAVKSMLVSESASLVIVGASVGVFVGVLTSYLFGLMWKPYDFPRPTVGADFTVMVFVTAALLVAGIILLATLSSLVGSSREPMKSPGQL